MTLKLSTQMIPFFTTGAAFYSIDRSFTKEERECIDSLTLVSNISNHVSENKKVLDLEPFSNIKAFINTCLKRYQEEVICSKFDIELYLTNSWVTVTNKDEYHHKHNHPNSIVSGILYVQANKPHDTITFLRDNSNSRLSFLPREFNNYNASSWTIQVKTGDLLLFDSNIEHCVLPQSVSSDSRVSINFNTFVKGQFDETSSRDFLQL